MRKTGVHDDLAREIAHLIREQNGAIHGRQLVALGLTRDAIRTRVARGRLVRRFRDVYIAGDPELMPLAELSAALLSLSDQALLSHRSAVALHGLAEPDPLMIDVTVIDRNPRPRAGVRLHRVTRLHRPDMATAHKLRVTAPARALIEFAVQATDGELARAFGDARAARLITDAKLRGALGRFPANHRGASIVSAMLDAGETYDRSKAERLMRGYLGQAGFAQPLANVMLHGHLVDFVWPELKLIVEIDGYATHGSRQAFEADRRRDQIHAAHGYLVIRITWLQLLNEPLAVIARIAQAIAHRALAA